MQIYLSAWYSHAFVNGSCLRYKTFKQEDLFYCVSCAKFAVLVVCGNKDILPPEPPISHTRNFKSTNLCQGEFVWLESMLLTVQH